MTMDTKRFQLTDAVSHNKTVLIFIVLALGIRITFFLLARPWQEHILSSRILIDDSLDYHRLALSIIRTGSFSYFDSGFFMRTPGYPLFISVPYYLWGPNTWIVLLLQTFIDTATVLIVYLIAKELFDNRAVQNISAFLYSICFLSACLAIRLLSEILFTFVFTLSILFFVRAFKSNKTVWYIVTGIALGIATLVRPIAQLTPLIICIVILFQRRSLITRSCHILIIAVAFFASLFPWQMRNKLVHGHYAISNQGGTSFCIHNTTIVKSMIEDIPVRTAQEQLIGDALENVDNPFERSSICRNIAMEYYKKNLLTGLKLNLKARVLTFLTTVKPCLAQLFSLDIDRTNIRDFGYNPSEGILDKVMRAVKRSPHEYFISPISGLLKLLEYLFCIIGIVIMFKKNQRTYAALFLSLILYFGLIPGVLADVRFLAPVVPLYLILSAYGISEVWSTIRARRNLEKGTASINVRRGD